MVAFDPGMRHITIRHVTARSGAAAYVGNTDIDSQYEDVATWTDVTKYYAGLPKLDSYQVNITLTTLPVEKVFDNHGWKE